MRLSPKHGVEDDVDFNPKLTRAEAVLHASERNQVINATGETAWETDATPETTPEPMEVSPPRARLDEAHQISSETGRELASASSSRR